MPSIRDIDIILRSLGAPPKAGRLIGYGYKLQMPWPYPMGMQYNRETALFDIVTVKIGLPELKPLTPKTYAIDKETFGLHSVRLSLSASGSHFVVPHSDLKRHLGEEDTWIRPARPADFGLISYVPHLSPFESLAPAEGDWPFPYISCGSPELDEYNSDRHLCEIGYKRDDGWHVQYTFLRRHLHMWQDIATFVEDRIDHWSVTDFHDRPVDPSVFPPSN